jgi:restriction system protein
MKNYYRVMLGRKSAHAPECFTGSFIGADFDIHEDLSNKLPEEWREFNKQFIPVFLTQHPEKTKIGAGLACGALWTVSKGIKKGDIVLSPDGSGSYRVGEVLGDYYYAAEQVLPHRRKVRWLDNTIARSAMSEALQNSTGSIGTISTID